MAAAFLAAGGAHQSRPQESSTEAAETQGAPPASRRVLDAPILIEAAAISDVCFWSGRAGDDPLPILVPIDPGSPSFNEDLARAMQCASERHLAIVPVIQPPVEWQTAPDPSAALEPWIGVLDAAVASMQRRIHVFEVGRHPETSFESKSFAYLVQRISTLIRSLDPHAALVIGPLHTADSTWLNTIPPERLRPYIDGIELERPVDWASWSAKLAGDYPAVAVWVRIPEDLDPPATLAALFEARRSRTAAVVSLKDPTETGESSLLARVVANVIGAVPARFVVDLEPAPITIGAPAPPGASTPAALAFLMDPLGPERAVILPAPRPREGAPQTFTVSLGSDPVSQVKALDLVSGRWLVTSHDGGRQRTGPAVIEIQGATGPVLLRYVPQRGPRSGAVTVGVTAEAELSAEEIIARERAFAAAQARVVEHYTARATLSFHYRAEALNETVDIQSVNRFYWKDGVGDYEETDLFVNGARWRGPVPSLPFVQAEKVREVPLEISLDESYRYELIGRDKLDDRSCYVIGFEPVDRQRSSYSGKVWIDAGTFARRRLSLVQHGLKEPITSSSDEIEYGPVAVGDREVFLPLSGYRQMIFTVIGRTIVTERRVIYEDVAVNGEGFEEAREQAYASDRPIIREDASGFENLTRDPDGSRTAKPISLKNVAIFGGMGFGPDSLGFPFAAMNYFDFDWRGTGTQLDFAFAGPFINLAWTNPSLGRSRWELTLEGRLIALWDNFKSVSDVGRREDEDVKELEETVFVVLGRPLTTFTKIELQMDTGYTGYTNAEHTSEDFVIPSDSLATTETIRWKHQRSGTLFDVWASTSQRFGWDDWGLPMGASGTADEDSFQRWGADIIKAFFPGKTQKISLAFSATDGRNMDRFSRFRIGEFRNVRVRGYNGADITFDRGLTGNLGYLVSLPRNGVSLTFAVDGAVIENDDDFGYVFPPHPSSTYRTRSHQEPNGKREWLAGGGVGVNWNGPWGTLMRVQGAWGLGTSMDLSGSSAAFRFVIVRTFDRWPWGENARPPSEPIVPPTP